MRWPIAFVLLILSCVTHADGPIYGELNLGAGGVAHSDLEFTPVFGSISAGAYVYENIGVELFLDSGIRAGEDSEFTLDIEQAYGLGLRLQSPPIDGVRGYVVLGVVNYTVEQKLDISSSSARAPVDGDFTGFRASIGLMQRLKRFPAVQFTAEYRHYNADEPIRLDAIVLGFRFNAP